MSKGGFLATRPGGSVNPVSAKGAISRGGAVQRAELELGPKTLLFWCSRP